jgi:hypothetical protein
MELQKDSDEDIDNLQGVFPRLETAHAAITGNPPSLGVAEDLKKSTSDTDALERSDIFLFSRIILSLL